MVSLSNHEAPALPQSDAFMVRQAHHEGYSEAVPRASDFSIQPRIVVGSQSAISGQKQSSRMTSSISPT